MGLLIKDMAEKPALDVTATSSTSLSGPEISAAMDALIAEGHSLESLTQRQVWKRLGARGSLETISKWFKRYVETKTSNAAGAKSEGKVGGGTDETAPSTSANSAFEEGSSRRPDATSARSSDGAPAGGDTGASSSEDPNTAPPLNYPTVPGAVLALLQNNFVRDIVSLKESHQRERELLREQTEDRVARARAEVRAEVISNLERKRPYVWIGVVVLWGIVGGIAAWSGFIVGRAEGGIEQLNNKPTIIHIPTPVPSNVAPVKAPTEPQNPSPIELTPSKTPPNESSATSATTDSAPERPAEPSKQ